MAKAKNLIGEKFGKLTVIRRANNVVGSNGRSYVAWYCNCYCGSIDVIATSNHLKNGHAKSCGCLLREKQICIKKYNKYDLYGDYGIGWTSNTNREFYFDLEDYDKIKDYCWHERKDGYIANNMIVNSVNKTVFLHGIIMNINDELKVVDHIHGQKTRHDNRKFNLRIVTSSQNNINKIIQSNNSSGVTGVSWKKQLNQWQAYICLNGKQIHLGYFYDFNDAVKTRKIAEEKYFGEYSYEKSQIM